VRAARVFISPEAAGASITHIGGDYFYAIKGRTANGRRLSTMTDPSAFPTQYIW
jgi:hypothetical protein